MIQLNKDNGVWEFYGLSTDDKDDILEDIQPPYFRPIVFYELDTGKKYYLDADSEEFVEWGTAPSSNSGGGATTK